MITNKRLSLLGVLLLLTASGVQAASEEGEQLLKSMQSAVHSLSYEGNLVFWKGNEMSEYHIEHQPGQGNSSESVIQLNAGNAGATQQQQQFSLVNSSSLRLPAQQVYSIDVGQDGQIAGLPCKVVVIRPKDKMRYLYRYCIHQDSGMLLKYSVMNRQQQLLEQFMFTQLNISSTVEQEALVVNQAAMASSASTDQEALGVSGWDLSQLPAGFSVNQVRSIPGKNNAHQVILSDGLTFVSVFIEPDNTAKATRRKVPPSGATNILTVEVAGHTVTMVGEVPDETLHAIKNGLRYVAP
ncbi:MAG: Sigma E regulatory protein, MucB/RseB [uncultured Thiotrichaceae bacterium]|uniref:Sigma E regulatory protein, MucB/RseB n=1 Tax=uncultured Thiotrichaceae bacterium TaxID=298394 RepID=A0A6S6SIZ4_9GAMM|nr:MAG: Sigma E regulatory protein, MucB/RseB [uncultured Thiotrichaceae bacterium]